MDASNGRRKLTSEQQFEVFLETVRRRRPIAEILRRNGLGSTELVRIRNRVHEGAMEALRRDRRRKARVVPLTQHEKLERELAKVKETLVQQTVAYQLLEITRSFIGRPLGP